AGSGGGRIGPAMSMNPPPGVPRWGAAYRDFFAQYYTRHLAMTGQTENLPYADQTIDLDPNVRDRWGLPAPRMTYDWRRPNERARVEFVRTKIEEIGRAPGARRVGGGRHGHGERSEDIGGEPLRPELGHSQPVRDRQLDLPVAERLQSDAHHPGAGLYERRRDREPLPEEPGAAALAGARKPR